MPTSRLAIDSLWRCLCPAFSPAFLRVSLRRTVPRQCLNNGPVKSSKPPSISSRPFSTCSKSSARGQARSDADLRTLIPRRRDPRIVLDKDSEGIVRKVVAVSKSPRAATSRQLATEAGEKEQSHSHLHTWTGEKGKYASLEEVPISELHDLLRTLRTTEGAFEEISSLVSYLVKVRGEEPCLFYYDALVKANADAENGSAAIVEGLMVEMGETGVLPDSEFYHSVLQVLAIHPDYILRAEVLKRMKERWFTVTAEGSHNVIIGLLRDRQYEMALERLEKMQNEGARVQPWLYDIFIYLFCEAEELDEALRILQYRVEHGDTDISANAWYYMLDACSSNYHYEGTVYIWRARVETSYLNPSDGTCTNVLNTAARASDSSLATDVVRVLSQRVSRLDMNHYEALLAAYVNSGDIRTALRILSIMKKARLEPTEGTTRPIFAYLTSQDPFPTSMNSTTATERITPDAAFSILSRMSKDGHNIPVAAINAVLSAEIMGGANHPGSLKSAIAMYKELHPICPDGPNTDTFNILLQGCAKTPNAKADAMFVASEMVALGARADELTYDRLVLVCLGSSNSDDPLEIAGPADQASELVDEGLEDALRYTAEMREIFSTAEKKAAPLRNGTWSALIKRCADRGDERAWDLLEEMEGLGLGTQRLRAIVGEALGSRGF